MREILNTGKFLVSLKTQQLLVLLVSIIIGTLIYQNYELREDNKKKDAVLDTVSLRFSNYVLLSTQKLEECEKFRAKDGATMQEYFKKRMEVLEERAAINYKKIQ